MIKKLSLLAIALVPDIAAVAHTFEDRGFLFETLPDYGCIMLGLGDPTEPMPILEFPALAQDGDNIYDIRKIANEAFRGNNTIQQVWGNGSNMIEEIGDYAFSECGSLQNVSLYYVGKWGMGTFQECHNLQSVAWSPLNSTYEIPDMMFSGCSSLKTIWFDNRVTSLGRLSFQNCTSLTWMQIPENITSIGEGAFNNCTSLRNVTFMGENDTHKLLTIGDSAFRNCSSLYELNLPVNVISIGESAFYGCQMLHKVALSEKLQSIGEYAFYETLHLSEITIPECVTSIGAHAFEFSPKLENVYMLGNVPPALGSRAFAYNDPQPFFYVLESAFEDYKSAESWSLFENIVDGEKSITVNMPNGILLLGNADKHGHTVSIIPEAGYKICTAMLGDKDISLEIAENGKYEIPRQSINRILNVTFQDMETGKDLISVENNIKVYAANGYVTISGLSDEDIINVYTVNGTLVTSSKNKRIACEPGIYIIKAGEQNFKVRII